MFLADQDDQLHSVVCDILSDLSASRSQKDQEINLARFLILDNFDLIWLIHANLFR